MNDYTKTVLVCDYYVKLPLRDRVSNRLRLWKWVPTVQVLLGRTFQHAPNRLRPHLLEQREVWVDRYGRELRIEAMRKSHARNLINYLHRNALRISLLSGAGMGWEDGYDGFRFLDPNDWVESRPLVRALRERLR